MRCCSSLTEWCFKVTKFPVPRWYLLRFKSQTFIYEHDTCCLKLEIVTYSIMKTHFIGDFYCQQDLTNILLSTQDKKTTFKNKKKKFYNCPTKTTQLMSGRNKQVSFIDSTTVAMVAEVDRDVKSIAQTLWPLMACHDLKTGQTSNNYHNKQNKLTLAKVTLFFTI